MWILKLIIFVLTAIYKGHSAKILGVFPIPSISHQVVFRPVMIELARRGHEVTVITPDPAFAKGQTPPNFTEIDVHDISYKQWHNFFEEHGNVSDQIKLMTLVPDLIMEVFEEQLKSFEVKKLINDKNRKFDLLFVESSARPAIIFSHLYKIPVISFSSLSGIFHMYKMAGAASHALLYPNALRKRLFNLTLWEKISELRIHFTLENMFLSHESKEKDMLKRYFGPHIPSFSELEKNIHMLFLNVHPIWDSNRPVPPNVIYLGGLHQKPEKSLPQDLKSYLDSSKHGVIYISFGTNVKPSLFPQEKLKVFTNVFSNLKYDILFKWEKEELPGRSPNVKISKWLPQSDLLRHPNVKLFITQGGLQSTDEALTAAVPLLAIPMLGDQWFNAEQYVKFKIGKKLLMETVTEEALFNAIEDILSDNSYRDNIIKLRNIMHDQNQSPLERAVWWTEYVLRHGGALHLQAPAAHMDWIEYMEIKLVILLWGTLLLTTVFILYLLCYIISKFNNSYLKVKDKKN
ncbi:unnamed protein product, partial [Brenthis ino]